jgi:lipoprotein-releasing system permease protein
MTSQVETWEDRHHIWLGAVENERNILLVIFLFFLLLVCTITFSVLTMMVQQKVRDIGILSAMGAPAGGIGAVFATCGIYIATLGGLFGLGAGIALAANINKVKDAIEDLLGIEIFKKEIYAFSEIPVSLDHTLNVAIAGTTVIGAVLICMMPAFRAARMDPVEALRHD